MLHRWSKGYSCHRQIWREEEAERIRRSLLMILTAIPMLASMWSQRVWVLMDVGAALEPDVELQSLIIWWSNVRMDGFGRLWNRENLNGRYFDDGRTLHIYTKLIRLDIYLKRTSGVLVIVRWENSSHMRHNAKAGTRRGFIGVSLV